MSEKEALEVKPYKKKQELIHLAYWLLGKTIFTMEIVIILLSMKVQLLEVIPNRLKDSYLDIPLTCFILLGYMLTFRSFFLAAFTDSSSNQTLHLSPDQRTKAIAEKKEDQEIFTEVTSLIARRNNLFKLIKKNSDRKRCVPCRRRKTIDDSEWQSELTTIKNKLKGFEDKKHIVENHQGHSSNCKDNCNSELIEYKPAPREDAPRVCLQCNIRKEKEDHHCSMCNKCVYRMDHHCFFLGQCVGDYNYAYFISYVLLAYIMSMINLLAIIPDLLDLFSFDLRNLSTSLFEIIFIVIGGLLFHFFTLFLFIQHMYYICNEITCLESIHRIKAQTHTPLQWVLVLLKGQAYNKLRFVFSKRWQQIFNSESYSAILFPEPRKAGQPIQPEAESTSTSTTKKAKKTN